MISAGLMNTLQVTVLVLVAAGATVVVRTRTRVRQVLALNPLTGLIEMFRFAVIPGQTVHWDLLALSLATSTSVFPLSDTPR